MSFLNNLLNRQEFLRIERDKDSSTLWIVISHVDIPAGKFAQTGVFRDLPGSKVFLNCPDNSWYQQGIPDVATSVDDLLTKVRALTDEFAPDKLVFVGHSMGAYLAILFGMHHPGSYVIATSPEFVLNMPGSRSLRNGVKPDPAWASLFSCERTPDHNVNGLIVLGVDDPIDAHFLGNEKVYQGGFGTIIEAPYHHGVTEFFTSLGVYHDLLKDPTTATEQFKNKTIFEAPFSNGTAEQYEHFYQTSVQVREVERRSPELVRRINAFSDWEHAGWQELRSKYFRSVGDTESAYDAAELAYYIRPHLPQMAVEYCRACLLSSRFAQANHLLDTLKITNPRHPLYQQMFALSNENYALRDQGRLKSVNRHLPAAGHSRKLETSFANQSRSVLRNAKTLLQDGDDDALFEQLGAILVEDDTRSELLRIAIRASSRHRLSWLSNRYIAELVFQNELSVPQVKVVLVTALRSGRLDLIHRMLPRINQKSLADVVIRGHLAKALELTSEPTFILALCDLLIDDRAGRLEVISAAERAARKTLNLAEYAQYLLSRLPEFDDDEEALNAVIRICCQAGLRNPADQALQNKQPEGALSKTLASLFPSPSDRATGE